MATDDAVGPLSRRSFLVGLAAAAVAASLDPFEVVSTSGRLYSNSRLGLSATLPAGWDYSSIADFVSLRSKAVLLDALATEHHALKNPEEIPVFIFESRAHRDGYFAPGVLLYDNPIFNAPEDEPQAHLGMLHRFARSYRDLTILEEPTPRSLGTVPATISRWSYVHEADGQAHELTVVSVLAFRNMRAHTFYLVDQRASPCIDASTWESFIDSIHYT